MLSQRALMYLFVYHLASRFNLTYRYIDDVLSINNPEFENYLGQMYPAELEINDTTESTTSASYLDLLLSIGRDGQLHTSIYDKRDDFNFHITIFRAQEPKAPVTYCDHALSGVCRLSSVVRRPSSVVRLSSVVRRPLDYLHFRLLLQNRLMDFDETWYG